MGNFQEIGNGKVRNRWRSKWSGDLNHPKRPCLCFLWRNSKTLTISDNVDVAFFLVGLVLFCSVTDHLIGADQQPPVDDGDDVGRGNIFLGHHHSAAGTTCRSILPFCAGIRNSSSRRKATKNEKNSRNLWSFFKKMLIMCWTLSEKYLIKFSKNLKFNFWKINFCDTNQKVPLHFD